MSTLGDVLGFIFCVGGLNPLCQTNCAAPQTSIVDDWKKGKPNDLRDPTNVDEQTASGSSERSEAQAIREAHNSAKESCSPDGFKVVDSKVDKIIDNSGRRWDVNLRYKCVVGRGKNYSLAENSNTSPENALAAARESAREFCRTVGLKFREVDHQFTETSDGWTTECNGTRRVGGGCGCGHGECECSESREEPNCYGVHSNQTWGAELMFQCR